MPVSNEFTQLVRRVLGGHIASLNQLSSFKFTKEHYLYVESAIEQVFVMSDIDYMIGWSWFLKAHLLHLGLGTFADYTLAWRFYETALEKAQVSLEKAHLMPPPHAEALGVLRYYASKQMKLARVREAIQNKNYRSAQESLGTCHGVDEAFYLDLRIQCESGQRTDHIRNIMRQITEGGDWERQTDPEQLYILAYAYVQYGYPQESGKTFVHALLDRAICLGEQSNHCLRGSIDAQYFKARLIYREEKNLTHDQSAIALLKALFQFDYLPAMCLYVQFILNSRGELLSEANKAEAIAFLSRYKNNEEAKFYCAQLYAANGPGEPSAEKSNVFFVNNAPKRPHSSPPSNEDTKQERLTRSNSCFF